MSSLIQTLLAGINCLSGVGPDKVSLIPDSGVSWPTKTVNANKAPKMRVFVGVQSSVHHKPWDNVWNFQKYLHWCWPGTEGYEKIHLQDSLASIVNLFQLFLAALWNWTVDSSVFSKLKSDQVNCVDSRFLIFSYLLTAVQWRMVWSGWLNLCRYLVDWYPDWEFSLTY